MPFKDVNLFFALPQKKLLFHSSNQFRHRNNIKFLLQPILIFLKNLKGFIEELSGSRLDFRKNGPAFQELQGLANLVILLEKHLDFLVIFFLWFLFIGFLGIALF